MSPSVTFFSSCHAPSSPRHASVFYFAWTIMWVRSGERQGNPSCRVCSATLALPCAVRERIAAHISHMGAVLMGQGSVPVASLLALVGFMVRNGQISTRGNMVLICGSDAHVLGRWRSDRDPRKLNTAVLLFGQHAFTPLRESWRSRCHVDNMLSDFISRSSCHLLS